MLMLSGRIHILALPRIRHDQELLQVPSVHTEALEAGTFRLCSFAQPAQAMRPGQSSGITVVGDHS